MADDRVTAAFAVEDTPVELDLRLDGAGRIVSLAFDRWGDPGYAGFGGLTIPAAGRLGWS